MSYALNSAGKIKFFSVLTEKPDVEAQVLRPQPRPALSHGKNIMNNALIIKINYVKIMFFKGKF